MSLNQNTDLLNMTDLTVSLGSVERIVGMAVETLGPSVKIGEICNVYPSRGEEPVKAEVVEVVTGPAFGFSGAEVPALALDAQSMQPPPHVAVELDEAARGVPGAEVVAPAP